MAESFAWGLLAGSSLVVGGLIALTVPLGRRVLGLVMAFGAGVLISAVAFELVQEAHHTSAGDGGVGFGLFLGALVFFVGVRSSTEAAAPGGGLEGRPCRRLGARDRPRHCARRHPRVVRARPDGARGRVGERRVSGRRLPVEPARVDRRDDRPRQVRLVIRADLRALAQRHRQPAAGAILTMFADTMMPEAYEHGGRLVGIFTTFGFGLAFLISSLE